MEENKIRRIAEEVANNVIKTYADLIKPKGFNERKLTDTPTDDLAVVNRRYVNLNGTLANRPIGSVATLGQGYFATNVGSGTRITYNGTQWTNGVGSVVAIN